MKTADSFKLITIKKIDLYYFLSVIFILLFLVALPDKKILLNVFYLTAIWVFLSLILTFNRVSYISSLFSPNLICFYYLSLSLCLGSLSAHYDYGRLYEDFSEDVLAVQDIKYIIIFLVLGLSINLFLGIRSSKFLVLNNVDDNISSEIKLILVFLLILILYSLGSFQFFFTYTLKLFIAISICVLVFNTKFIYRFITYLIIIYPFTIGFSNKREMLLVVFLIFFY